MDNNLRAVETSGGVGSQIYTTLCVNLLTVRLVKGNYDNLMVGNETARGPLTKLACYMLCSRCLSLPQVGLC